MRLVADVEVQRRTNGELIERYRFHELNRRPYSGRQPPMPMFVEGAVNEGLLYFLPSVQPFFVFTFGAGRIDFSARLDAKGNPPFMIGTSTHGFAYVDRTGAITHIERYTDAKEAERTHVTDYAAYEFTPTELNGTNLTGRFIRSPRQI